jgi:hypothetical protein
LDFDSYDDIEDEVTKSLLSQSKAISSSKPNPKSRQETNQNVVDELAGMTDSLDFENSDDLNKII